MKQVCPLILAAALMMAACGDTADAPTGPEANRPDEPKIEATAPAAPATPAYYPAGYVEMKEAAAIFAKETYGGRPANPGDGYGVIDCGEDSDIAEIDQTGDPKQLRLEAFAREIARHESFLSRLFPDQIWKEPLRDYEKASLAHIAVMPPPPDYDDPNRSFDSAYDAWEEEQRKLEQAFATAMEERRQRLGVGREEINIGGECGAGEQPFLVKTQPANGRLWIATKFSFDLCKARKLDPWNPGVCRWTEVAPDHEAYLSGRYVYQVRWPDGVERRGVRAFDGEMTSDEPTEVVIGRP